MEHAHAKIGNQQPHLSQDLLEHTPVGEYEEAAIGGKTMQDLAFGKNFGACSIEEAGWYKSEVARFLYELKIRIQHLGKAKKRDLLYKASSQDRQSGAPQSHLLWRRARGKICVMQMQPLRMQGTLMPNTSLKLSANGVARWACGAGASPHFAPPAQRATPSSPA